MAMSPAGFVARGLGPSLQVCSWEWIYITIEYSLIDTTGNNDGLAAARLHLFVI